MYVSVVGAGNFGTVIANIVAGDGTDTYLYVRDEQQLREMRATRENSRYLPGHRLVDSVIPTSDLSQAVKESHLIFVTVPSASFRAVTREFAPFVQSGTCVVSATKGVEGNGFRLMSQILEEELHDCMIGVVSGPNLAEEIADGQLAGTVIASRDPELISVVQQRVRNPLFRVYSSSDVFGVELGGALKNIYAIICGMASAFNIGQSALSLVITRSLAEMSRFAVSMGANPYTFLGLAGVGDLVATCTSPHSRNFQLGYRIAKGASLDEASESLGKLAEGVNTLRAVYERSKILDVHMPLAEALHHILFEQRDIRKVIGELMESAMAVDVEFAMPDTGNKSG